MFAPGRRVENCCHSSQQIGLQRGDHPYGLLLKQLSHRCPVWERAHKATCLQGRKDYLPLHPTRCYQRHITAGDGRGRSRCPTVLFAHHGLNAGHPGEVVNPTE